ncbi:MAG: hypothetical protein H0W64_09935 [Gammaproteobacteria bacterium]|nr:hypothetical protein [Gammaproteobacteria bacterium]
MQSNFLNFKSGIARTPPCSMAQGITTQNITIDVDLAREQHHQYLTALNELGISISLLEPEESLPDSHFVEDAAIIYKEQPILLRPGALERRNEVECLRNSLKAQLKFLELEKSDEGTVDGGDVLLMGEHVLIGISYRTNLVGAEALAAVLRTINPHLTIHFIEFSGVLHLKSGFVALNDKLLLGNPHIKLKRPLPIGEVIWLPAEEGYAANTLVANGAALVFAECTTTQAILKQAKLKPIPLDMSEFRKMDGSFTCLSLLW